MNKADINNVIGKLVPDKGMEQRLSEKILQKQHIKFPLKRMASICAGLAIVVSLGVLGNNLLEKKTNTSPNIISSAEGIYIPKLELPKDTNSKADMMGLIVYQGRVYTQTGTKISSDSAKKLLGEKLGTTKGNIDEWSKQKDYAVELASSIGKQDVYSVKGYDKGFRIMTYMKIDGTIYSEFFECSNGITVKSGADIFSKLKIENNIKEAKYEKYDSWNNNKQLYKEFGKLQVLNSFVNELKNTVPYTQESLTYLFDDKVETKQKFVYITLNDGSQVQLRLFKDGYIYYDNSHIFFKMEKEAFDKLWNELE